MWTKTLRVMCLLISLVMMPAVICLAQGPPGGPGGPAGPAGPGGAPGHPGGMPGPPGAPNGPGSPGPNARGRASGNALAPQRNALQFGPVGRWWDNKSVTRQIGLRPDQQKRMDVIFDANKPAILSSYKAFLKAKSNLAAVNKDPKSDKSTVFAAIDALNGARSDLQKATSTMLLQIRGEMEPSQIEKLQQIP